MSEIDLHRLDLNLLVVFDVLMAERSVTRAAERLGRTQSAVSHALGRLRQQLGDPMLIKGARGMAPTPFALAFFEQTRPILQSLQRVMSPRRRFDPTTSTRVFRLAAPDFAVALFTDLLAAVRAEAPGVTIEWTAPRTAMLLEIAERQLDAAIAPAGLRLPPGVSAESIGALTWRCFARRGHPAFRKWSAAAWERWLHLVVRVGDRLDSPVNAAVAAAGLERRIAGWAPNFSVIAPVLARTDLLATLPALAMADTTTPFALDSRPVPFAIEALPHALLWSASRAGNPEIAWLRAKLRPIVKRHFAGLAR
ncbi:MAG TPA: LysR substrate-binding domain-containing protein [Reyranella sp.]|nr:LysR substrate-binding domain-containing protein [Reyranella sp.]